MINPKIFLILFLFAFSSLNAQTQQNPVQKKTANEVEELRKKVEEQERLFKLMEEQLQKQNAIVEQQQKQIDQLLKLSEQKDVKLVPVSKAAEVKETTTGQTIETKPTPQATPKPINNVEAGFGKIRFTGLIQSWYSAGTDTKNTFRFRRLEMKFTGQILPKVKWTLMIDPAKALNVNTTSATVGGVPVITSVSPNQSSRILQEAYITLNYIKDVNIDIGQYKIPLSQEALQSSSALDTVERALFLSDRSRGGGLADNRDFGIQFSGLLGKNVNYQIGVFNGTGENQNISDTNQQKAVVGRFIFRPAFFKGLQVGTSGAWSNSDRITNPKRDRLGGELLYSNSKFKFKTEVMGGIDGEIHRLGFYTHFGYKITPRFEAIFRIDGFDPDRRRETNSSNVSEIDYVGGFNYYITDHNVKFQFNYIHKTFNNGIQSSKNLFLANLQTAW
jgi:Phosphate-selective porin O and P